MPQMKLYGAALSWITLFILLYFILLYVIYFYITMRLFCTDPDLSSQGYRYCTEAHYK